MNKRGLPVFLVASCLAASAAAQTPGSPRLRKHRPTPRRPMLRHRPRPRRSLSTLTWAAARSETRTKPCSITPPEPTTKASPSS